MSTKNAEARKASNGSETGIPSRPECGFPLLAEYRHVTNYAPAHPSRLDERRLIAPVIERCQPDRAGQDWETAGATTAKSHRGQTGLSQ